MSRKPIHLQSAGPRNERQAMWEVIRAHKSAFSAADIRGALPGATNLSTIRDYLQGLANAGYLQRLPDARHRLVKDVGVQAPRVRKDGTEVTQGLAQERLWRVLRIMRAPMTVTEILAHANSADYPIEPGAVTSYLGLLQQAGYLHTDGHGRRRRYRLIPSRDTGPRPPMIQRTKQVFDPNLGRVVWQSGGGA